MIQEYSQDCDYLRKKFKLREDVSLYELIRTVTQYIINQDDISILTKEEPEISKEKKRGRPRKKQTAVSN